MSTDTESRQYASRIKEWMAAASSMLSLIAIIISLVAFYNSEQRRKKDIPFELIPKAYEKYYEMNKIQLEKWHLGHMFVTYDRYKEMKDLVATGIGDLKDKPKEKAEYLSQERAVADFLFTYYEQTLFQWEATKDRERQFIEDILKYFRERLLPNPRLVYWWRESGGGLETSYENVTRKDWTENVYQRIKFNSDRCDPLGPFGSGISMKDAAGVRPC